MNGVFMGGSAWDDTPRRARFQEPHATSRITETCTGTLIELSGTGALAAHDRLATLSAPHERHLHPRAGPRHYVIPSHRLRSRRQEPRQSAARVPAAFSGPRLGRA